MATITVLGGTGHMGALVSDLLEARGDQVRRASRSSGVDVGTGVGLAEALAGADVVVDCLNVTAMTKRVAVPFFAGGATRITRAAQRAGIGHLVLLSILNVTEPAARTLTGYYAAKAAQESVYVRCGLPVTVVATTAWFTLAQTFLSQLSVGPVAAVPMMRLAPVHPEAVAELLVEVAHGPPPDGVRRVELAGPQVWTAAEMAEMLTKAEAPARPLRVLKVPLPGSKTSVLLPRPDVPRDERTFQDWLGDQQ